MSAVISDRSAPRADVPSGAAAEAAVGLAIIIAIFRARNTLDVDQVDLMKL